MLLALFLLLLMLFYVYFGYAAFVWLIGLVSPRRVLKVENYPSVSILIAAYNEAEAIGATIENKLQLDYPKDKLEIIVVSDSSDDGTDDIVRRFSEDNVRLFRQDARQGKTAALNLATQHAKSEVLVFSDANSAYAIDALRHLAFNFADPDVGYVTGKMVYVSRRGSMVSEGCSAYMRYENGLRTLETCIGSIVGVDGGIDAVRRELYTPMDPSLLPDLVLPLNMVEKGFRVVYEPAAILREEALDKAESEYRMRVRVSLRAFHALWQKRNLFNLFSYGFYSVQLLSHKVLRYLVGFAMVAIFAISLFQVQEDWGRAFLAVQIIFYALALFGWRLSHAGQSPQAFYVPFYFCLVNIAAAEAFIRFLKGDKQVTWKPREGGTA